MVCVARIHVQQTTNQNNTDVQQSHHSVYLNSVWIGYLGNSTLWITYSNRTYMYLLAYLGYWYMKVQA